LESAYLQADAAHTFSDNFMTVSRACLGAEVNDWAQSPEQPLPAESAAQLREIGRVLSKLDFPPPVPAVAPPEK
jgi:hypothetical protein